MKLPLSLVILAILGQTYQAYPLQLHNRLVFTRDDRARQNETVWTMNSDGSQQRRVWRVPKGYGQFGSFSRDGKRALSFNQFNIYTHDLHTQRIHHALVWSSGWGTYIRHPSFSPDGRQIVCEVGDFNQNTSHSEVLRLQANKSYSVVKGLEAQKIRPLGEGVPAKNLWSEPRWSAGGKKVTVVGSLSYSLMYSASDQTNAQAEIWTMNADGTAAQQITRNPAWDLQPAFSPNGQQIAFVRRVSTDYGDIGEYADDLWCIDTVNGAEKQLTFFPKTHDEMVAKNMGVQLSTPLFSPDGAHIAFEQSTAQMWGKDQKFSTGIYRIDVGGKNQKRLSDGQLVQWIS